MKKLLLAVAAVALIGVSLPAVAQQRTYSTPYRGNDGRVYMHDNYHCFYVAHQGRWHNAGCHNAAQAQTHNQQVENQLREMMRQYQQQQALPNGNIRTRPNADDSQGQTIDMSGGGGNQLGGSGGITSGSPWSYGSPNPYRY